MEEPHACFCSTLEVDEQPCEYCILQAERCSPPEEQIVYFEDDLYD